MHSEEVVCLMPLSQYKRNELYKHVESFELANPKMFEDAVITENLCVCEVKKAEVNKFDYATLAMASYDSNYLAAYEYSIENTRNILPEHLVYSDENFDIEKDFIETSRSFSSASGAGFGIGGAGYKWNHFQKVDLPADLMRVKMPSKKAKENFTLYWYSSKKGVGLASKLVLGVHSVHSGKGYYFSIPQIDWEKISDHPLWNTDVDAAVLDTMNLKWNEDKTCIVKK